jgi:tetratricopeptide (TPR) repeat protein
VAHADASDIPSLLLSLRIEGDPNTVLFEKGKILYKIMAYREAATLFSQIQKGTPENPEKAGSQNVIHESLYLRANSLMKIGDYSEAMAAIDSIPVKSRFYNYGLYTKAMISLNTEREKEAIEYLDQLSNNFPVPQDMKDKPEGLLLENFALKSHLTLGFIYLDRNEPSEAIRQFAVIPKDSPFYMQALFGSGWAYANMDRWVRAVVFWEELAHLYPESQYTIEIMPYIGHAYATLSAYGKALEQNGIAMRYYEDLLKKSQDIEREVRAKNINGITRAVNITGDKESAGKLDLYNGLLSMEEYLEGKRSKGENNASILINASMQKRGEIVDAISESLRHGIEDLKKKLLDASVSASLEIAGNLRLEEGGHINNEIIFNGHD